jgi:hypothetical protein
MAAPANVSPAVEIATAWITFAGTVAAAIVVSLVGTVAAAWIAGRVQRERDRQDKESQWRSHAIELTKLDADRLMKRGEVTGQPPLPLILTFLANYRDLSELGTLSPAALYEKILKDRISRPEPPHDAPVKTAKPARTRKTAQRGGAQP